MRSLRRLLASEAAPDWPRRCADVDSLGEALPHSRWSRRQHGVGVSQRSFGDSPVRAGRGPSSFPSSGSAAKSLPAVVASAPCDNVQLVGVASLARPSNSTHGPGPFHTVRAARSDAAASLIASGNGTSRRRAVHGVGPPQVRNELGARRRRPMAAAAGGGASAAVALAAEEAPLASSASKARAPSASRAGETLANVSRLRLAGSGWASALAERGRRRVRSCSCVWSTGAAAPPIPAVPRGSSKAKLKGRQSKRSSTLGLDS